jgi:hypothetical protein
MEITLKKKPGNAVMTVTLAVFWGRHNRMHNGPSKTRNLVRPINDRAT